MALADKLISHYGTAAKARAALNICRQTLWVWRKSGIPAKRAVEIERRTRGKITAAQVLRSRKG